MPTNIFNTDGSIACIPSTAKTELADAPGLYILEGISETNGYPVTFEGKCLLVKAGTTQSLATGTILYANGKVYYKYDGEWRTHASPDTIAIPETLAHFIGCFDTDLPTDAVEGDICFANGKPYYHDGSTWVSVLGKAAVQDVYGKTGDVTVEISDIDGLNAKVTSVYDNQSELDRLTCGAYTSPVIGICVREAIGSYIWYRIDVDGYPVEPSAAYFDLHPIYNKIRRCTVDGQIMQVHQKFYYKCDTIKNGPFTGLQGRWVSPTKLDGFKPFPSFMKAGKEIDTWYCGAFQATLDSTTNKLCSLPGSTPLVNTVFDTMRTYAQNRSGFDMWNIHQVSEIQLLALIEAGTTDFQTFYGSGYSTGSAAAIVDDWAVHTGSWRGHEGLWGNIWQGAVGYEVAPTSRSIRLWNDNQELEDTGEVMTPTLTGATYVTAINTNLATVFLPKTVVSASEGSLMGTYVYIPSASATAATVFYCGGSWSGDKVSMFTYDLEFTASQTNSRHGTRISKF